MINAKLNKLFGIYHYLYISSVVVIILFFFPWNVLCEQKKNSPLISFSNKYRSYLPPHKQIDWINSLVNSDDLSTINISEPLTGTVFPPDMASPLFLWEDLTTCSAWLITIKKIKRLF